MKKATTMTKAEVMELITIAMVLRQKGLCRAYDKTVISNRTRFVSDDHQVAVDIGTMTVYFFRSRMQQRAYVMGDVERFTKEPWTFRVDDDRTIVVKY